MKPTRLLWPIVAVLLVNGALVFWNMHRTPHLAYVRSKDLVYGYFGMKEAMSDFQQKKDAWKANLDTLDQDLQRSMTRAKELSKAGNTAALQELQPVLRKQQENLGHYREVIEQKAGEEEQRMLSGVLGQVNTFVESYAKEHGYDVVLGTTDAGSLLYGAGGMDITNDLLAALNKEHDHAGR